MTTTKTRKVTEFETKVYNLTSKIPKGAFSTYKLLSLQLKSSPRAVGQALKRNPFAPKVPCHRVLSSDYSLGGFYGEMKSEKKMKMLREEGLDFDGFELDAKSREKLYRFDTEE